MNKKIVLTVIVLLVLAALTRLYPVLWNFSPIAAIALLGGSFFKDIKKAILIPLGCLFMSDTLLHLKFMAGAAEFPGFYPEISAIYLSFALIVLIGRKVIRTDRWTSILGASIIGSLAFFLITNFAVWMGGHLYPMTFEGLVACFTAAIPFFRNTLVGDLFFVTVLFGAYKLASTYWNSKQLSTS